MYQEVIFHTRVRGTQQWEFTGLPADVHRLRAVRTSQSEGFQELSSLEPRQGVLERELAP